VEAERADGSLAVFSCRFLFACTGYYDYASGHLPDFPGRDRFAGQLIHAQHWPDDLSYTDKRVVVIGSGATAMTLVPALTRHAAQVTMLQRTPTYVVSRPARDKLADRLRTLLPAKLAYGFIRWRNVLAGIYFFNLARKRPESVRQQILEGVRAQLGPDFDIATHFAPPYDPWDQRLCLVPDGDLFEALKSGKATVVTDHIETFTTTGIELRSGKRLDADLVVAATGLRMQLLGGVELSLDGAPLNLSTAMAYKGCLYSDVPNFAFCFGYTNASWTLKCDLTCDYVCRVLNLMDRRGYTSMAPRRRDPALSEEPMLDFSSGYVQRAIDRFPKQGSKPPWKMHQNYIFDLLARSPPAEAALRLMG
jgi:cation diffusion facilitator CzcD-associated flavoprotein CzcO